jgi:beta-lactamase class A
MPGLPRREFLAGACALVALPITATAEAGAEVVRAITALEQQLGGRIGVRALDTRSGWALAHRAAERFAMCSTFKVMLAAAILSRTETGSLQLEQPVRYSREQLLPNSPVTAAHVAQGQLPLAALAQAAIEVSDNTAANCLLDLIGGPQGYTHFLRRLGDTLTRLDRTEVELNSNLPGDPRDTTTPAAMLADVRQVLLGSVLSRPSRTRLISWMKASSTGRSQLRARLPAGWEAGDKTGRGQRGAVNDVAIFWPPGQASPILIACYMSGSDRPAEELNEAHARIGALVADAAR